MINSTNEGAVARTPLLETKLHIPRWRPGLVMRPRLVERLHHGTEGKLTLVSAPAGFGKTTLLAEWLAASPADQRPAAWFSLDPGDNDPVRFWAHVLTGIQSILPGVGANAFSLLRSQQAPSIESILTTVINEIAATGKSFVLVLDDLHVIETQPVHDAIAFLLDHLPAQVRLVVASRSDPPLPLPRLRARGELTEIRAADLRFTPDEAASFLNNVMSLELSADDVATLETRTEGWIAGLQLAALSMRGRADVPSFISAFAGDARYIVDYLVEEVLQRQPEHVRRFLLQTSILERLSGPLCDAVTRRNDGKRMLEALERDNLFVVPLDDTRQWYRYHHLFADVLRAHLQEEESSQIPALRRHAAIWFEERGMAAEAIEQALAAGDHEVVGRLLAGNIEEFERTGLYASIARWAASLPAEMVRQRPRLALIHALSALRTESSLEAARRLTSWAEAAIGRIEAGTACGPLDDRHGIVVSPDGLDALKGEALALRVLLSARKLPPNEVAELARQALDLLPPAKQRIRGTIQLVNAGLQTDSRDPELALRRLEQAVHEARGGQDPLLLAGLLEHRGQMSATLGKLDNGRRSFEEAINLWQRAASEANWTMCDPHARLADVLLEQGDLPGAIEHVVRFLDFAAGSPKKSFILIGRGVAARAFLAAGNAEAALAQLLEAESFAHGVANFRFASFLSSLQIELYCRMGNLDLATAVAHGRSLSADTAVEPGNVEEITACARYLIARADYGDAAELLTRLLPVVRDRGRVRDEIHALALQALALERLGKRSRALEALGRATMLGEPGRFNRTFTGEGLVLTGVLEALATAVQLGRGPAESGSQRYLANLLREDDRKPALASAQAGAPRLAEPLTPREVEILRLIASGMRNEEIAGQLFISLATVKRHIANTYGKLGVSHRVEAINRATELGLL